jgi:hypothetical protein
MPEPDVEIGLFWTVNGFVPDPTRKIDADGLRYAERYQWQGEAMTARQAEDLAKLDVKDKGMEQGYDHVELFVTAVMSGRIATEDRYARFLDPDIMGET